tara:strand:- start:1052 stop:1252 length:201 start_codon:yes stop_codon:yes gene_type:complete
MRILNAAEVGRCTNLSRVTIWRMERSGKFPPRVSISANRVGWREDEIEAWIESRPRVGGGEVEAAP